MSTSTSGAPGCTCQNPSSADLERHAAHLVRRPGRRRSGSRRPRPRRGSGACASPGRPPGSVDVPLPGPPAAARRRRRAPPRPSTSTSRPASRASCSRTTSALSARCRARSTCWKSQPPHGPGRRTGRAAGPGPGEGSSTSTASARQNRSPSVPSVTSSDDPLARAARAGRRRPGPSGEPGHAVAAVRDRADDRVVPLPHPGPPARLCADRARAWPRERFSAVSGGRGRPLVDLAAAQVAGADPEVLAQLALAGDLRRSAAGRAPR